jgi:hypothetical protein
MSLLAQCAASWLDDKARKDEQFMELLRAFRRSGGVWSGAEKGKLHLCPTTPPLFFEHGGALWIPRFQFDTTTMELRPECCAVFSELIGAFDGWEQALWFASPNVWLGNARPIDVIDSSAPCVLGAARADRFIALG